MKTNKTIHALLVDYYDYLSEDDIYKFDAKGMAISRVSTLEAAQSIREALVFDLMIIEKSSYTKHRRQFTIFEKSFEGVTIIVSSRIESFHQKMLHEFYFINDTSYVIRPISPEDIQQRVSGNHSKRHPLFKSNRYLFMNALIEKLAVHGAHEFNTPMNGILGVLNLMKDNFELLDEEDRLELLNAAVSSCIRLKRTYTNLVLSIRGFQKSSHFSFQSQTNVQTAVNIKISELITERGFFFNEVRIEAANLLMAQEHFLVILHESLDNAIKFGDPSIGVLIEGVADTENNTYLLSIRDYGQRDNYDFIDSFDAFIQHDRIKNEQQGWGLGLFLISQIAHLYKIKWSIQPCLPGTAVEFSIPLNK